MEKEGDRNVTDDDGDAEAQNARNVSRRSLAKILHVESFLFLSRFTSLLSPCLTVMNRSVMDERDMHVLSSSRHY